MLCSCCPGCFGWVVLSSSFFLFNRVQVPPRQFCLLSWFSGKFAVVFSACTKFSFAFLKFWLLWSSRFQNRLQRHFVFLLNSCCPQDNNLDTTILYSWQLGSLCSLHLQLYYFYLERISDSPGKWLSFLTYIFWVLVTKLLSKGGVEQN